MRASETSSMFGFKAVRTRFTSRVSLCINSVSTLSTLSIAILIVVVIVLVVNNDEDQTCVSLNNHNTACLRR